MKTASTYLLAAAIAVFTVTTPFGGTARTTAETKNGDAGAQRPFQRSFCIENGIGGCGQDLGSQLTVPTTTSDGEAVLRLVIEYVSGQCVMTSGGLAARMVLQTTANASTATHLFAPFPTQPGSEAIVAQATRLYADPGSVVLFAAGVINANSICRMKVSGHLAVE